MKHFPSAADEPDRSLHARLSAHIDGQLSHEEAAAVELQLRTDPQAKRYYESITRQRRALANLYASSTSTLPDLFAERVVDAAIERARSEGVDESHPLILAGDQPSVVPAPRRQAFWHRREFRRAAVAMVLAASLAGIMIGIRAGNADDAELPIDSIAAAPMMVADEWMTDFVADDLDKAPAVLAESEPAGPESAGLDEVRIAELDRSSMPVSPDHSIDDMVKPDPAATVSMEPSTPQDSDTATFRGMVLVLEVRCNETVTRDVIIQDAMRTAGLQLESQRQISEGLVTAASEASGLDADATYQMMYLSASAKRLDRLYLELLMRQDAVESVGLSLAMSAPITQTISQIQSDPTVAAKSNVAIPFAASEFQSRMGRELAELTFAPLSGVGLVGDSFGGDEEAQAILIVR